MDELKETRQERDDPEEGSSGIQRMMALIQHALAQLVETGEGPGVDGTDIQQLRQNNHILRKCLIELNEMMDDENKKSDKESLSV